MRKKLKTISYCLIICAAVTLNAAAAVYYTTSSSALYNSDGIGESKSVVSSPVGGTVSFKNYAGLAQGAEMYRGAIFDGESIWLVPGASGKLAAYSREGELRTISLPESVSAGTSYCGGTFDGDNIYLAPYDADAILQIDPDTDEITLLRDYDKGGNKYKGAVFDGEFIWFIPSSGKEVLCMSSLGEIKEYEIPAALPAENAFAGAVLCHEKIYFVPDGYNGLVVLNRNTGEFTLEKTGEISGSYCGGVFDGEYVYFIPNSGGRLLRVNYETGTHDSIALPEELSASFSGGAFDGRYIWLAPNSGQTVVRYDIYANEYSLYQLEDTDAKYFGGAFDGKNIWLAPYSGTDSVLRISGDNTPPAAMNLFLTTTADLPVQGELSATDQDTGDVITFVLDSQPTLGSIVLDAETGELTYTPAGETGTDVFYYHATDSFDNSNTAAVTVTIIEGGLSETGRYIDLWGHWAEEAANYLTDDSVFLGENVDGFYYFYPDYNMTRGTFAVLANSAFGFEGGINDNTLPFADISDAERWVIKAASGAYHGNMMAGTLSGEEVYFNAKEELTRVEAMTVLYNVIQPDGDKTALDFSDAGELPEWSHEILQSLKSIGMLKGYDDNTIRPFNKVTRAEAVQLLYEAVKYLESGGKTQIRLK